MLRCYAHALTPITLRRAPQSISHSPQLASPRTSLRRAGRGSHLGITVFRRRVADGGRNRQGQAGGGGAQKGVYLTSPAARSSYTATMEDVQTRIARFDPPQIALCCTLVRCFDSS